MYVTCCDNLTLWRLTSSIRVVQRVAQDARHWYRQQQFNGLLMSPPLNFSLLHILLGI